MVLGIPTMDRRTFSSCLDHLSLKNAETKSKILEISHREIREKNLEGDPSLAEKDILDICVSYDGTWQKRGHTSLYGIGVVIDILTGLVVDFEILSKYCHDCLTANRDLEKNTHNMKYGVFHIHLSARIIFLDHQTAWKCMLL